MCPDDCVNLGCSIGAATEIADSWATRRYSSPKQVPISRAAVIHS